MGSSEGQSGGHDVAAAVRDRLEAAREGGDAAVSTLRAAGCRPTAQRLLVWQAVARADHATADDVLAHARERYPSITPSTVYRALEALTDAGLVLRSDLGSARQHYEIARHHRHHHAVCQSCGAVAHVHQAALAPLDATLRAETGYALTPDREVTIPGLCPACQAAGRRG